MKIHLWGTDFRRSPPEFRRRLHIPLEERVARLSRVRGLGFIDIVYLGTCNRVEFYTTAKDYFSDTRPLWLSLLRDFDLAEADFYQGYHLEGKSALRHLLRVASSLESMVVGEPQILGQLREAIRWTTEHDGELSPSLQRAFQLAFETAKRVRSRTAIGVEAVSIASLGLEELQALEDRFALTDAVVVGRSPMANVVVQWLSQNRPEIPVRWVNRTPEKLKSEPLARTTQVVGLEPFLAEPGKVSHLFTATSSNTPIFGEDFFERVTHPTPVAFDFAEPPDIGPAIGSRVTVVRIDDLRLAADRNRERRKGAALEAEHLIDIAIRDFFQEQKEAPVLRNFSVLEPILLDEARSLVAEVNWGCCTSEEIERWAQRLVKKNLHTAREHLKGILKSVAESDQVAQAQDSRVSEIV